jgi:CheY-like chemotaxis protein
MSRSHLLIVEDDADIRETLGEALELAGYTVTLAENGADALERLRRDDTPLPAVILLDLMMPVMDGFAFRSEQRRDPRLAEIPVIVITAGTHADATAISADFVMRKPIAMPKLLDVIARTC